MKTFCPSFLHFFLHIKMYKCRPWHCLTQELLEFKLILAKVVLELIRSDNGKCRIFGQITENVGYSAGKRKLQIFGRETKILDVHCSVQCNLILVTYIYFNFKDEYWAIISSLLINSPNSISLVDQEHDNPWVDVRAADQLPPVRDGAAAQWGPRHCR